MLAQAALNKPQTPGNVQLQVSSRVQQTASAALQLTASAGRRIVGRRFDTEDPVSSPATASEGEEEAAQPFDSVLPQGHA